MEEMPVDENGVLTTLSLGDYKLPGIMDIPRLRTVLVHAPPGSGPFGAKMIGELSNTAVAPAVANAIYHAAGVRLHEFPATAERVFDALVTAKTEPSEGDRR
jgi:CO/xanthine dehydrogenase Mo-binding subunit